MEQLLEKLNQSVIKLFSNPFSLECWKHTQSKYMDLKNKGVEFIVDSESEYIPTVKLNPQGGSKYFLQLQKFKKDVLEIQAFEILAVLRYYETMYENKNELYDTDDFYISDVVETHFTLNEDKQLVFYPPENSIVACFVGNMIRNKLPDFNFMFRYLKMK